MLRCSLQIYSAPTHVINLNNLLKHRKIIQFLLFVIVYEVIIKINFLVINTRIYRCLSLSLPIKKTIRYIMCVYSELKKICVF